MWLFLLRGFLFLMQKKVLWTKNFRKQIATTESFSIFACIMPCRKSSGHRNPKSAKNLIIWLVDETLRVDHSCFTWSSKEDPWVFALEAIRWSQKPIKLNRCLLLFMSGTKLPNIFFSPEIEISNDSPRNDSKIKIRITFCPFFVGCVSVAEIQWRSLPYQVEAKQLDMLQTLSAFNKSLKTTTGVGTPWSQNFFEEISWRLRWNVKETNVSSFLWFALQMMKSSGAVIYQ